MANNSKYTPAMRYPEIVYRRNRQRSTLEEKQKTPSSDTGKPSTHCCGPANCVVKEADARTPMTIYPPLLHSGSTYVEDILEGVSSEETSTDDTLLRRSSRVSKPVNRLISEI